MRIAYSSSARRDLDVIGNYNASGYGAAHAERSIRFVERTVDTLAINPRLGNAVNDSSELRFLTVRRRTQGYGHVVVYRVDEEAQTVRVLHVFHTAQDWRGRLEGEF